MTFIKKKLLSFFSPILSVRSWVIATPYVWLGLFFVVPFFVVLRVSLSEEVLGIPPYTDMFLWVDTYVAKIIFTFESYTYLIEDDLYLSSYLTSLKFALITTIVALLLGFPMAIGISNLNKKWQIIMLLLIMLPFWTSFLIRIYAWLNLLTPYGLINSFLIYIGVITEPLRLLFNNFSVTIGMVYCYLPFMILPIYVTLEKMDPSLQEAASDLGAKPFTVFKSIILPLSFPGLLTGSLLVFIPCVGEFVIPEILGGSDNILIGRLVWNEFFLNHSWPTAAALSIALLVILFIPIYGLQKLQKIFAERLES